jgi:shikimate kinase/3-dehydroquinate synthase
LDRQIRDLIITGFSGTGKSLVGREAARRLGWDFLDTDDEIVKRAGKPIADIFGEEGEHKFRQLERDAIKRACRQTRAVIAVGGGAIVDSRNYEILAGAGLIICLEARPETIYERLFRESACSPDTEVRPLLAVDNPVERIRELKAARQPHYARADWTIHTDALSVNEVAGEVIRAWELLRGPDFIGTPGNGNDNDKDMACMVEAANQSYPVFVGYGLLDKLGEKMKQRGVSGTAVVISDENVFSFYGGKVGGILSDAGFAVNSFVLPPGEETKCLDSATKIYDYLIEHRIERDDVIVALGGGVVGDLTGFVAATFLRGVAWVQAPTSLMAMVDAAIGGKVGVNHPEGKNLIGAFYQPSLVLADCETLKTLPRRELTSGWAEVVKYGLILDKEFFEFLEVNAAKLRRLRRGLLTRAVARSAIIKAGVVSQDEKEREGKRTILNYGHTIAHGLEAATHYRRFLHGEAVAIGMMAAAKLSQRLGLASPELVERQRAVLQQFGLPTSLRAAMKSGQSSRRLNPAKIITAMELDKKVKGRAIRWVLLEDIGKAVVCGEVPQHDVEAVLKELAVS